MPDPKHEQLKRLFDLVIAAPVDQRETLLNRECGDDLELRQRVSAMVQAADDVRFPVRADRRFARRTILSGDDAGLRQAKRPAR